VGLNLLHNVSYAAFSLAARWLADRFSKHQVLAGGYFLATVNGVGGVSSLVVGGLWTGFGTSVAFGYSAVLFAAGALQVLRVRRRT
jgi:hypothetical protein